MPMLSNIFFDLDGTLTDSQEGIIRCIQHSIKNLGLPCQGESELKELIGVPLRATFEKLLGTKDKSLVEKAVSLYRDRYTEVGILENTVYPGIVDLLSALQGKSFKLYVMTTKPKIYADRIVRHFHLNQWFSDVYGTGMDGRFDDKGMHINLIMDHLKLAPEQTLMVGDRREDILAGKKNQLRTIGVTYGYGNRREIIESAPDFVCNSPDEILSVIIKNSPHRFI
jgi:phosphoglycolate phosphatase